KGKNAASDPFTVNGLGSPATMTLAPRGTPIYKTTYGNIAPRIGLAYQFRGIEKWDAVVRAGFGVFFDLGQGSLGGIASFFPYQASKSLSLAPFPLSAQNAAPAAFPVDASQSTIFVVDPQLKLPRTYQWNLALEQSI